MASFDLYNVKAESIFEARLLIESLLSINFTEHDSLYHRGPYFRNDMENSSNLQLKFNRDPFEDVPDEDKYPTCLYLLYVNNTHCPDVFRDALFKSEGAVTLLQHEDL